MNKFTKMLSLILALAMVFSMTMLTGCNNSDQPEGTDAAVSGGDVSYSVSVKTAGGMALEGIDVYVYTDNTLSDLKQYGATDAEGKVSITMPQSDSYAIVLSGVAKGYEVAEYYTFNGTSANITLTSGLITGENLSTAKLGLGDVMYDFSVMTSDGETVTLSDMLKEKEMVLINFWYTTCPYCVQEFPYMEEAYQQYQDKVGIIALDPMPTDNETSIANFKADMGLSFPMAACQASWPAAFEVSGYPTSVIVDRYGVICLIESGGILSLSPFISTFEHFTGDDYEQRLVEGGVGELTVAIKPTYEWTSSEEVAALLGSEKLPVTYRPETEGEDAEYSWPFIQAEKNGETCVKTSNQEIESSYAIMYMDVELKAGEAIGFDYLVSTEKSNDVMHVIVNDEPIYTISGVSDPEEWKACYPWVALEDGTYEVALCYIKDESNNEGDDAVYIKNVRIVGEEEVDVTTYIPRYAATTQDGFEYSYVDIVLNEKDGYYHVGDANGPLLLANLMAPTDFNEEKSVWDLAYDGTLVADGHNYYDELVDFCSYASNAALNGHCTVNKELAELLKITADIAGFDGTENEWMKTCVYYQVYGSDEQLVDPIKGLETFCAYEAKLGKGLESNSFYYDRPIIPRGLLAEFTPDKSGVYRITSRNESQDGVEGWIFDKNHEELYVYEQSERLYNDSDNVSMLYYMEAGEPYYIDIAFWDMYQAGYIYYDIEYVGASFDLFRTCAPGYFTYDSDATGNAMYHLITGGIDVVLGEDGIYYEDLGKDANGKQKYGSKIYADFTGITGVFGSPIANVPAYNEDGTVKKDEKGETVYVTGMIDLGGFDFSRSEDDLYIISFLKKYDGDVEATDAYLRELWGEDYDAYAELYQLEDVYEGRYHGKGEDLSDDISAYLDDIITSGPEELRGCVVVTEDLAELLQKLMDKYTFENVDDSWTKICYYYQHLGA